MMTATGDTVRCWQRQRHSTDTGKVIVVAVLQQCTVICRFDIDIDIAASAAAAAAAGVKLDKPRKRGMSV